jgi:hypothetical protein
MTYQANRLTPGLAIPDHDGIVNHYSEGLLTKVFYYTSYSGFYGVDSAGETTAKTAAENTAGTTQSPHSGGNLVATLHMKYDGSNLVSVQKI